MIAASDSGFAGIVKLLVDKISELPEKERQKYLDYKKHVSTIINMQTLIMMLIIYCNHLASTQLIDPYMQFSWTALMSASEKGHAEVVKILIEAGASRSITKDKVCKLIIKF